jgi:apolipoprotein N-acyltransferase
LILWPETAFPSNLHETALTRYFPSQLKTFIAANEKPFLVGGYREIPDGPYYNSLFYINKNGEILENYDKSHLLAFGEYLPGSQYLPFLKDWLPEISDFGRGPGPSTLTHTSTTGEKVLFGPQICYEGLFPYFSKGLENKGAQIFVNVTNDSWFGHTFESYQHLYMTLARAIEFRRPLVRSTNTGISAVVTHKGEVILKSPQEEEWFATIDVPYQKNPDETFYAHIGFYLTYELAVFALIVCFLKTNVFKS